MSQIEYPNIRSSVQNIAKGSSTPITLHTLGNARIKPETISGLQTYVAGELKKSRNYIQTIHDLVRFYYPFWGKTEPGAIKKDAPALTTTTGWYNAVFGRMAWEQINNERNAFAMLPKKPWDRSGWRVITAAGATSGGGVAENAAIPSTIKPTIAQISTKPKTVATGFNLSSLEQELGLAGGDDMFEDPKGFLRDYSAREHLKLINRQLLTNVTTLPVNNTESIDRAISSYAEVTNCADVDANDSDIYGIDRDTAISWADAYVNENANVDRKLTLDLVDSLLENTRPYAGPNDRYVLLTGHDTIEVLQRLRAPQLIYREAPETWVRPSVNGVQSVAPGADGGFMVASYRGIPILVSNDVPKDTISRIYLINLEHMFMKVLMPTQYFETGLSVGQPFAIDKIADEGLFVTMTELITTNFRVHGKVRDLQA